MGIQQSPLFVKHFGLFYKPLIAILSETVLLGSYSSFNKRINCKTFES